MREVIPNYLSSSLPLLPTITEMDPSLSALTLRERALLAIQITMSLGAQLVLLGPEYGPAADLNDAASERLFDLLDALWLEDESDLSAEDIKKFVASYEPKRPQVPDEEGDTVCHMRYMYSILPLTSDEQ